MKIGVLTITFNEPTFIEPCIKQFSGFDVGHVILVSKKPWHGDYEMDHTWAIAKMFNERGLTEIDYWEDCATQFNHGMEILEKEGYDWTFIVDTDEFYTPNAIGQLIGEMRNAKADAICAPFMSVYWKTPEYLIVPKQNDNPIVAIRTNKRFTYIREADCTKELSIAEMHHMSYVRTDEEMKKKIDVFEHSHEFDREQWYKEKWLKWNEDMEDLHPVVPRQFKRAIRFPAPQQIRSLLEDQLYRRKI